MSRALMKVFVGGEVQFLAVPAALRFWPAPGANDRPQVEHAAAAAAHDDADPYSDTFDPWGDSAADEGGHL